MRLLLDTHTLLWFYLGDARLTNLAKAAIEDATNEVFVSPASYWEIAIKIGLGKYQLHESYSEFIQHSIFDNCFKILPVEPRHTAALLMLVPAHKDPFDRLLIAQALVESMTLVGGDPLFAQYPVGRIW